MTVREHCSPDMKYPQQLINTTVRIFVASKAEDLQPILAPRESPTVRIVLPLKDQDLADLVRKPLYDLCDASYVAYTLRPHPH